MMRVAPSLRSRLLRVAKAVLLAGAGWAARLLHRLSPRTFSVLSSELRDLVRRTSAADSFVLRLGDTRFRLHVVADRPLAHFVYGRWAAGGEVVELVMLECLTRLLRHVRRPAFIDIGAFMGHYACYAAALLQDREETYAIESNPRYCAAIERSIRLNGFGRLKVYNVTLSDRVESARIEEQAVVFDEAADTRVRSLTLDELCRREGIRPKIVKIDVHGTEGKVLRGMQDLMKECLEFVLLELHSGDWVRRYSGDVDRAGLLTLFEEAGFHVFHVAGHRYRGSGELRRFLETAGFAYRRLDARTRDLLLFDRPGDIFLLCSRTPDLEPLLGRSVPDPCFGGAEQ